MMVSLRYATSRVEFKLRSFGAIDMKRTRLAMAMSCNGGERSVSQSRYATGRVPQWKEILSLGSCTRPVAYQD